MDKVNSVRHRAQPADNDGQEKPDDLGRADGPRRRRQRHEQARPQDRTPVRQNPHAAIIGDGRRECRRRATAR